jgi:predicted permease
MAIVSRLMNLFRRSRLDREISEELRVHIEMRIEDNLARGMTPEEARREALVRFGNATATRDRVATVEMALWAESVLADLRYAFRQLAKTPAFAATAIGVLALGMGAGVAIFAFVDAALLQPLPYDRSDRLMAVNESSLQSPIWPLSYADFKDWQRLNKSFSSLDVIGGSGFLLRTPTGAEPVQAVRVSGGFFKTMGVRPVAGRDFNAAEGELGGPKAVMLSYGAWVHRFGGRNDAVGRIVDLDGEGYTIVGVLPRSFGFGPAGNAEFWTPINRLSFHEQQRTFYAFWGVGRLRDGVTAETARAEMTAIEGDLQKQYAIKGRGLGASVIPLAVLMVGQVRPVLLMFLGGAGLLLLIASVNVASLVLARSESRKREVAVRGALGATGARLLRQFVTESLMLAGLGTAAGLGVALALMKVLAGMVPQDMAGGMPFLAYVGLNTHTALFAGAASVAIAVLIAGTAALRLSFRKIRDGLAEANRATSGRVWSRLGANLVAVELAVAVVLLTGAGLLAQSLYRLLHVPLGFDPAGLASVQVTAPPNLYKEPEQMLALYRKLEESVAAIPGVQSVGLTSRTPAEGAEPFDDIDIVGKPNPGEHNNVTERHVSAGYLRTIAAGLSQGEFFTREGASSGPGVAVINQTLARKYFPNQNPIGQRIADDEGGHRTEWRIVGVVEDVREGPLDEPMAATEYFPMEQTRDGYFTLVVQTQGSAAKLLPTLVSTIHGVDLNLGASDEQTVSARVNATQTALLHRFAAWLVSGFAAVALLLSSVGLYGVIAYSVSQRTREIGVRMALGAQRDSVYRMILREAGWLTALGVGVGLVSAVLAATLIRKLLFGTQAWDVETLAAVSAVMAVAALLASYFPARRAARVNPSEALRAE